MPLRLKSLELQGYKTFASRTHFEFAGGITAIVGPNGSGKSNIADALRWVLGEQSYSLLRGKKTEDMIFSGSEHRPRAGMASAEIVFDNSVGWLPVEFSEVALTRRAYRDGHNEYLLNSQHIRLRDINELLAASGLSERTYTILGQGLVDASLALKAEERRRLFEEAAGVGLYRVRREESIRRLENTQHNLERVLDIMAELEPRLKTLERQARRANEYIQAQGDLKVLLLDWYGYHWHHAQRLLAEARDSVRTQEKKLEDARQGHSKAQAEYMGYRENLSGLRSRLNAWHRQSSELHSQREAVSRDLAVLEERRRSLTSARSGLMAERERAANEDKIARERLEAVEGEAARLQGEYDEARKQLAEAQAALQARLSERTAREEKLQTAREELSTLNARKAEGQARLDELGRRLESQRQKYETAAQAIEGAQAEAKKAAQSQRAAQEARLKAEQSLREAETELAAVEQSALKIESDRRAKSDQRAARDAEYSRLRAQLEVLEQAEQSLAGYAEGARFLLDAARQTRIKGARGAISASLDVPAELETAIAAALGDSLDAVLLEPGQVEEALRLLESEEAGRAALIALDGARAGKLKKPSDAACLGLASELINAPADLRGVVDVLLGHTLVARDRAAARRLLAGLPAHARVVTLRGEVFRADGLIIAGKAATVSNLGRPRQKRELAESAGRLREELEQLNHSIDELSTDLTKARANQASAEEAVRSTRSQYEVAQASEQKTALEMESARRQADWQASQRTELEKAIAEIENDQKRLVASAAQTEAQAVKSQQAVRSLAAELDALVLDETQERVSYWTTRVAVAEQAVNGLQARQSERKQALQSVTTQHGDLEARLAEADAALTALESEKSALRESEGGLQAEIEKLRVQIEPAEQELETAEQEELRIQEKEAAAQRSLANTERLFGQLQLDQTRRQEALENLREKIVDDFGLVSFDYATDVAGPVPLPFEGMVEQLPKVKDLAPELEEQLGQQRARLRRMGPINPEAKQEYDAQSERFGFMKEQVEDLRNAEADLRKVINELDVLTRQEFSKTFQAVDKEFRHIFVKLFGGGSARLALTDPDNLVETGIEVEARLPGRREQGLSLLSGGERSLTAIALVFALLKVSPTPICVMDEVDAMLDEANVGRFRDLLVSLSKDTQFIVITHNRNTVQAADVIYGITMGRDSASQLISLKLDEISEEMLGTSSE